MRELRSDAEFLRAERSRRKAGDRGSKQDERQANYAWLQTQAQNWWSGKLQAFFARPVCDFALCDRV